MTKNEMENKIKNLEMRVKFLEAKLQEGPIVKEIHHHYNQQIDQPLMPGYPYPNPIYQVGDPIPPNGSIGGCSNPDCCCNGENNVS